jgi:fatty-acyl-CoA synthase
MPITPMFHVHAWGLPYVATMLGLKQVYPGRYDPELPDRAVASGER